MILYFLRHGHAGDPRPTDDEERPLTDAGALALEAAARLWRRLNLRPDVVVTSPLARAAETAELLCDGLGLPKGPQTDDRLAPGAGWGEMARIIADHPDARRIMFVGHEPDMSAAVSLLTGASSVRLRKGGIACVEFPGTPEPGTGELAWLIDPDLYKPGEDG